MLTAKYFVTKLSPNSSLNTAFWSIYFLASSNFSSNRLSPIPISSHFSLQRLAAISRVSVTLNVFPTSNPWTTAAKIKVR